MPNKSDGDDVLQETLLAAYSRRETLKNPDGFKAWLFRIAANKCNDFYRQRAKLPESLPDSDTALDNALSQSRCGITVSDIVQETFERLDDKDTSLLRLVYIDRYTLAEIARMLGVPTGTVKSRLFTAKQRFKRVYPYPPSTNKDLKGMRKMHKLPEKLPKYEIVQSNKPLFPVKWEETMGWFMVPKPGEKISWAMYNWPEKTRSEVYELEVVRKASVHGIEGVEIVAREHGSGQHEGTPENRNTTRTFVAQLTDTHCRFLAQSHYEGDIKRMYTFLDGDDFLHNWGFGEDNCGNEINLVPKGTIKRTGSQIETKKQPFLLDVVGRYTVTIGGKIYDCVCVIDVETYNDGVLSEQFIDVNGRTVLWRRFNRDDWKMAIYKQPWSEKFPHNERLTVNENLYIHWYDCITDYIL
jgi:RNA polymerase sigma factor (sigma-70 family)